MSAALAEDLSRCVESAVISGYRIGSIHRCIAQAKGNLHVSNQLHLTAVLEDGYTPDSHLKMLPHGLQLLKPPPLNGEP